MEIIEYIKDMPIWFWCIIAVEIIAMIIVVKVGGKADWMDE